MKICKVCSESKSAEHYYKNRAICKDCLSRGRKEKYLSDPKIKQKRQMVYLEQRRHKRLLVWDYLKTHHCVDCGESNPMVLEFDHRDRKDKSFEISEITRGRGVSSLWAEIAKCDVRCANCHRKKTWVDLGWEVPYEDYDWRDINVKRIKGLHGNTKVSEEGVAANEQDSRQG